MKNISLSKKFISIFFLGFLSFVEPVFSAEKTDAVILDISIDYSNDPFYSELWFWIIIGSILLFLLILLIRGGRNKSKPNPEELV